MSLQEILDLVISGMTMEEAVAHYRLHAADGTQVFESDVSSCSFESPPEADEVPPTMLSDCWARIDPLDFTPFTLGRPSEELENGLIVLNLVEWRWIRRHLGSQPPPPVLVWLPPPGDNRPEWSGLREARSLTVRFPH
jgi:hypothetical protein